MWENQQTLFLSLPWNTSAQEDGHKYWRDTIFIKQMSEMQRKTSLQQSQTLKVRKPEARKTPNDRNCLDFWGSAWLTLQPNKHNETETEQAV